jgi:hypothetical protein
MLNTTQKDVTPSVATVLKFQIAVAEYDFDTAMSFIDEDAELTFHLGRYKGLEAIKNVYQTFWFSNPLKMISLTEAKISYTLDCEGEYQVKYVFNGAFLINDNEERRISTTFFNLSDDGKKIKGIRRRDGYDL